MQKKHFTRWVRSKNERRLRIAGLLLIVVLSELAGMIVRRDKK